MSSSWLKRVFCVKKVKPDPVVAYRSWVTSTVISSAMTVDQRYANFKHIIEVRPELILHYPDCSPFSERVDDTFRQKYCWPNKPLGDCAIVEWVRCTEFRGQLEIDDCFGHDRLFVATNNDRDALMISMRYT